MQQTRIASAVQNRIEPVSVAWRESSIEAEQELPGSFFPELLQIPTV